MKRTFIASALILLGLTAGQLFATPVFAQATTPAPATTATSPALPASTSGTKYLAQTSPWTTTNSCYGGVTANGIGLGDCSTPKSADGSGETCTANPAEYTCTITYSDKSTKVVHGYVGGGLNKNTDTLIYDPSGTLIDGSNVSEGAVNTTTCDASNTNCKTQNQAQKATADATSGVVSGFVSAAGPILSTVALWAMQLSGVLLGIVGSIYNWVIQVTVFQFGSYFANQQGMLAAWGILRDVANIMLLFGFIFCGIALILDLQTFNARHTLPRLVIFAVLLNFSLFASEAIVDVANVLSATLYSQAGGTAVQNGTGTQECVGGSQSGSTCAASTNVGISGIIMHDTYLDTVFNNTAAVDTTKQFMVYISITIFIVITTVVLAAGAIALFARAVMLCLLLIISPIGIAGMAIPQLEDKAKIWWQQLITNAFFAPIYLLLIFISLKILATAHDALGAGGNLATALSAPTAATSSIFIVFGLVIAFMIAAIIFAQRSGSAGASFATSFAQRSVQKVVSVPFVVSRSMGGMAYRGTVGKHLTEKTVPNFKSFVGNMQQGKATGGIAKIMPKGVQKFVANQAIAAGVDVAAQKSIEAAANTRAGLKENYSERKTRITGRNKELAQAARVTELDADMTSSLAAATRQQNPDDSELRRAVQKMGDADIRKWVKKLKGAEAKAFMQTLSADKYKKTYTNEEMTPQDKQKMFESRFQDTVVKALDEYDKDRDDAAKENRPVELEKFQELKKALSGVKVSELQLFGQDHPQILERLLRAKSDPAVMGGTGEQVLADWQRKDVNENDIYTNTQKGLAFSEQKVEQLKRALETNNTTPSPANTLSIFNLAANMSKDEFGGLEAKIITNPALALTFNEQKMQKIMSNDNIERPDRAIIINNIQTAAAMAGGTPAYNNIRNYMNTNNRAKNWWGLTADLPPIP